MFSFCRQGVGYGCTIINAIFTIYNVVVMAWSAFYLVRSFYPGPLPWTTCSEWFLSLLISVTCLRVTDCIRIFSLSRVTQNWDFVENLPVLFAEKVKLFVCQWVCHATAMQWFLNLYKHAEPLRSFPRFCRTPVLPNITESKNGLLKSRSPSSNPWNGSVEP